MALLSRRITTAGYSRRIQQKESNDIRQSLRTSPADLLFISPLHRLEALNRADALQHSSSSERGLLQISESHGADAGWGELETVILTPRNQQGALPILLERTPYGVPEEAAYAGYRPDAASMEADGYVSVYQNIRGRFESEGEFEMNRPPRSLMGSKICQRLVKSQRLWTKSPTPGTRWTGW